MCGFRFMICRRSSVIAYGKESKPGTSTVRMTAALAQWVPRLIGLSLASQNLAALILPA
jgi:hypothetical protein